MKKTFQHIFQEWDAMGIPREYQPDLFLWFKSKLKESWWNAKTFQSFEDWLLENFGK